MYVYIRLFIVDTSADRWNYIYAVVVEGEFGVESCGSHGPATPGEKQQIYMFVCICINLFQIHVHIDRIIHVRL